MKKIILILVVVFISNCSTAQVSGSFKVGGDFNKFYPVTFYDGGWTSNTPTSLTLGRSSVHTDSDWRGALMSIFKFHVTAWGHGANFIDADIKPSYTGSNGIFISSWTDATSNGTCNCIIIWLRGGETTYYYQSNYAVNPEVYDGSQNDLPYYEVNGPAHNFKTTTEDYATTAGSYARKNAFFADNVGIGTINPDEKLTVKGRIHAQEVRVDMLGPLVPDYVFKNNYKLKTLQEVEDFIKVNNHLPEVPSATEIEKNGLMLAEMNMLLLKKMEEMTLYVIEQNKIQQELVKKVAKLQSDLSKK